MYAADTRTAQPASKEWHTTGGGVKGMKSTTEWRLYVLRNFRPTNLMDESDEVDDRIPCAYIRSIREASLIFEKFSLKNVCHLTFEQNLYRIIPSNYFYLSCIVSTNTSNLIRTDEIMI